MSVHVGRIRLRLQARRGSGQRAADVAHELRGALPGALGAAFAARGEAGVAVIPRMHVTLRAPLGRIRGRDIARAIAEACADAAATRSTTLGAPSASSDTREGTAERALRAARLLEGVRFDAVTEAAAWIVALASDERSIVRSVSPYADCEPLPFGTAFAELSARTGDARALIDALGRRWSRALAGRCSDREARRVLELLDDGIAPEAATWRALRDAMRTSSASVAGAGRPPFVRALLAALDAIDAGVPGAVAAARTVAGEAAAARVTAAPVPDAALTSTCTGFWLLLPHLAHRIGDQDDETARAIALAVAEKLFGARAPDDPAIAAFAGDARVPEGLRLDRLAVGTVRDFARTIGPFRRARCGYVVRAILTGAGSVRRDGPDAWSATLPQAPLRIVLERASPYGRVETPWNLPLLVLSRDGD